MGTFGYFGFTYSTIGFMFAVIALMQSHTLEKRVKDLEEKLSKSADVANT